MADEPRPVSSGQIREGAGLEESRLSQDTIDLLTKWGWPILMILALAALGYSGLKYLKTRRADRLDAAFVQLNTAEQSQSPDALLGVASDFADVGAVPHLARLDAADIHLHAARTGVAPGTQLNPDGTPVVDPKAPTNPDGTPKESPLLSEEQRRSHLDAAGRLYQQVADDTSRRPEWAILAYGATIGLAAVAESRGDLDAARVHYVRAAEIAKAAGLPDLVAAAESRRDTLDDLKQVPRLYAAADLFGAPKPAPPPLPPPVAVPVEPPPGLVPQPSPVQPPPAPAEPAPAPPAEEPAPTP
jgi:hypothetical protein